MSPIFRLAILGLWCFALSAAASMEDESRPTGETRAMLVDDAVKLIEQRLVEHPSDWLAWLCLGSIHFNAYARGIDALNLTLPAEGQDASPAPKLGFLRSHVKRLESVSKERAGHLAAALRAYQMALECEKCDANGVLLSIGYSLYECRDRFVRNPWPFSGREFDTQARESGADARWWEDQALSIYRQILTSKEPKNQELRPGSYASMVRPYAAWHMLQILESRVPRSAAESAEIETVKPLADQIGSEMRMTSALQENLPTQPAELASLYPVTPAGMATAQLYFRAMDARFDAYYEFEDLPIVGTREQVLYRNSALSPDLLSRIETYLRFNQEAFRLLREGSTKPYCRFPVDLSKGEAMEMPHFDEMRGLAKLLAIKILYSAETDDSSGAANAFLDCLGLANSLRKEPVLISQYLRCEIFKMALDALKDAQDRTEISGSNSSELQVAMLAMEGNEALILTIKGLQYSTLQSYRDFDVSSLEDLGLPADVVAQKMKEMPTEGDIRIAFNALLAAANLPFPEARAEFMKICVDGEVLVPPLPRSLVAFARTQAQLRSARVSLAVGDYAPAHGALPETLDALVPEYLRSVPLDPFDDQPLRYRREGEGFIVYSVGDNLVDDGGVRNLEMGFEPKRWADVGYAVGMPVDETTEEHR